MKNTFPQYFSLKPEEFDELWENALIVPDTNILLHLLRYGETTRKQVIDTLEALQPRVWIPYRVGKEFLRRWRDVDSENRKAYGKLKNGIEAKGRELCGLFDQFSRHQVINSEEEKRKIESFIGGLCNSLENSEKMHPSISDSEKIVEEISEIIGDMVGREPNEEVLAGWIDEAAKRYDEKTPPGYMDAQKEGVEKYGDYFVWREVLEKAKAEECHVVFLSDDRKEDWVYKVSGKDVGPRTELVEEFYKYTGKRFHSYSLVSFLEHSKRYVDVAVSDQALAEIEERYNALIESEEREFSQRIRKRVAPSISADWQHDLGERQNVPPNLDLLTDEFNHLGAFGSFEKGTPEYFLGVHNGLIKLQGDINNSLNSLDHFQVLKENNDIDYYKLWKRVRRRYFEIKKTFSIIRNEFFEFYEESQHILEESALSYSVIFDMMGRVEISLSKLSDKLMKTEP